MTRNPNIPANYQTVMPYLILEDAAAFIRFMETVFNAKLNFTTMRDEKNIMHAEIMIDDCTIMLADATEQTGKQPACLFIHSEKCDETYKLAIEAGASSLREPSDQPYGRSAGVKDPFGNSLWITSVKSISEPNPQ